MTNKILKSSFHEKLKMLLLAIGLLVTSLTTQMWAYDWTANKVIYFDNTEAWANCYLRVGHTTYSSAYQMTQVPNTLGLYKYKIPSWGGYAAYSIANNSGWTGSNNSIYKVNTGDSYAITRSTVYQNADVKNDRTIFPTDWNNDDDGCSYYKVTNNSGLTTYSVTRSVTGSGTLAIKYTSDGDGTMSTSAAASSGYVNVIRSGNVEITATPSSGYALTALSLGGKTFSSADLNSGHYDFSGVREAKTLSATFTEIANKTIRVKDTDSWGGIYVYMWNAVTGAQNAAWPGVEASKYNGSNKWYTVTLSTQYTHFIISKKNASSTKSGDITISSVTNDNCYTTTTGDIPSAIDCPDKPTVTTNTISTKNLTSATLGGNITHDGSDIITEYGYYYSTDNSLSSSNAETVGTKVQVGTDDKDGSYSKSQTGLAVGTTYYVIAYAKNVHGTGWGSVRNFTTTLATLSLSGTADYGAKTMTITPSTNMNSTYGFSGTYYRCITCTAKPTGAADPTMSWNSSTSKFDISGTVAGTYTFKVQLRSADNCGGSKYNNAEATVDITMKDFVDLSGLTINHTVYDGTYMNGNGASATPYFIFVGNASSYGKLNLSATLAAALSEGSIYYSVGGTEKGTVTVSGTAVSKTMDLPNKTVGANRSTTIKFYQKLDGQTAPDGKKASVTVYYTVNTDPVVTVTALYNGNPIVGNIPQNADITVSASVTQIPGEPTFLYKKGSGGSYTATTTYTMDAAGTTTMYAKTSYLGDWVGTKDVTTYAAHAVTLTTRKTDMYGDDSSTSTTHLFSNTGEEYSAPDIDGYTFSDWACSNLNVQVSDNSGSTWKSTSTKKTVYVKATATGGTLTAHYTEKKRIYFDGRNTDWGTVYVYLFNNDVWHSNYGVQPKVNIIEAAQMTRIEESKIYYYEYTCSSSAIKYVAFSKHDQRTNNYLYATKGAYRGDFSDCNPVYVPDADKEKTVNSVDYFNDGYWRRYMPRYSAFSLYFTDGTDSGDKGKFVPVNPNVDGEDFVLEVLRAAGTTYHFNLPYSCGGAYGNNGEMTKDNCTNWTFEPTSDKIGNCGLKTTAEGTYKFYLSTANGVVKLSVEYPLSQGDYQIYYTDATGKNNNYSNYIRKNTGSVAKNDTVSFFVKKNSSPTYQIKRCTGFSGSTPTWENVGSAVSISVAKDSVYNFVFRQQAGGASISKLKQEYYSGDYYIRTDGAAGGWQNYLSNPDNKMKHTEKASALAAGYNYYYLRWIGDADGNSTTNVKFVVATKYNDCVSQEYGNDPVGGSLYPGQALTGKGANVRFTYHPGTNNMTRTCIGGSGHDPNYLVIDGTVLKHSDGSAWSQSAMSDKNDWIYTYELKASNDATVTLKSHYNNKYVTVFPSTKIFETTDGSYYDLRVIYDYKTNEVVAAYVPSTALTQDLEVDVDIMFIRHARDNHDDVAPTALNLNGHIITGDPKTLYGAIQFEKDYVRGEGTYSGLASNRPIRSTYWISFPFDVRIKDIFGLGDYTETWIIQRYRGDLRASKGWFKETKTFWEYVMDVNYVMKAGEGYALSIDCEAIQWPNNITTQYLYFPSKDKFDNITTVMPTSSTDVPEHTCTITSPSDRTIQDSHWNVIGIPGFTTGWGKATETVQTIDGNFHYFYTWNPVGNVVTSASAKKYNFQFMHSYMVQYHGNIDWTVAEPAAIPARRADNALPEEIEFCVHLMQGENDADHTFITLMDNEKVTTGFDMNTDLVKMFNANKANIYTLINGDIQSAANCVPMSSEQTTIIPIGVQVAADGDYTFSMPDGTNGVGVTLIDGVNGERTNLALMDYTVSLEKGTFDQRFVLEISPIEHTTTAIENSEKTDAPNNVCKRLIDGVLYIIKDGKVFDARGARLQ